MLAPFVNGGMDSQERSLLFQCLLLSCYRALQSDEGEERRLEQRFILEPTVSSNLTNFLLKPTHLNSTHHCQQHLSFVDCAMKFTIKLCMDLFLILQFY